MLNIDIHRVDIRRRFALAIVLLAVVLILFLLVGVASGASTSSPEWDLTSEHPEYKITESEARAAKAASLAALQLRVQEQGSVRVIVGLDVAFQPEGDLASPQAVQDQQARIAKAQDALLKRLESFDVKSVGRFEYIPFIALEVDAAALADLSENPDVISLEKDVPVPPTLDSSIPVIGADDAWAAGYEGSGWQVAILDTGVDGSHSFLTGKVVSEACYSSTFGGSTTVCPGGGEEETGPGTGVNCDISIYGCDHGTHVAGIAAGKGGSFHGVAREANLIAIQVFSRFSGTDCTGFGLPDPCSLSYTSDQVLGLERVYALRSSFNIASANMSLGGGSYSSYCDATQASRKAAIDNLRSVNIATVISSGNSGYRTSISAPACISTAISVGSTTDSDVISSFSNVASFLSLLAPGSDINSSIPGGGYDIFNGTSMSAPHVSGAWAILKSKMPSASVDNILNALQTTGVTVNDTRSGGSVTGMKRIQIDAALNAPSAWIYLPLVMKDFGGLVPTPTPTALPGCGLVNCDFESGPTGWVEYSLQGWPLILEAGDLPIPPHGGNWATWLGGDHDEISYILQQVQVPVGSPYFAYWHWIESEDLCGYDFGGVMVNSTVVDSYDLCSSTDTGGWVHHVVNLSAYAGQTVDVQIRVETDSSFYSSVYVDDVAFQSSPTPITSMPPILTSVEYREKSTFVSPLDIDGLSTEQRRVFPH